MDVICDACQGSVVGIRYKCLECVNYDLCQTFADKNLHLEHNILKLTRRLQHLRWCGRGTQFIRQYKPPGFYAS